MRMDPFIEAEEVAGHSVKRCCELFEVSKSAYYQRQSGQRSRRQVEDEWLLEQIERLHGDNYYAYGYRRTWKSLGRKGVRVGRDRVGIADQA